VVARERVGHTRLLTDARRLWTARCSCVVLSLRLRPRARGIPCELVESATIEVQLGADPPRIRHCDRVDRDAQANGPAVIADLELQVVLDRLPCPETFPTLPIARRIDDGWRSSDKPWMTWMSRDAQ
jgi:hypothetical protein